MNLFFILLLYTIIRFRVLQCEEFRKQNKKLSGYKYIYTFFVVVVTTITTTIRNGPSCVNHFAPILQSIFFSSSSIYLSYSQFESLYQAEREKERGDWREQKILLNSQLASVVVLLLIDLKEFLFLFSNQNQTEQKKNIPNTYPLFLES